MMKKTSVLVVLGIMLGVLTLWLVGCAQPGETTAEGNRRHLRNLGVNQQEMMQDVDRALLTDKPSKLTDKKMP